MDDGIGRTAQRADETEGILERALVYQTCCANPAGNDIDDRHAGRLRRCGAFSAACGKQGRPRKSKPEHLGDRRHGGRRAEHIAAAHSGVEAALELFPFGVIQIAESPLIDQRPHVIDGEHVVLPARGRSWTRNHHYGRLVRTNRPHELGRNSLVTAGKQHDAVDGG